MSEKELIAIGESKPLRKDFFLKMGRKGYSVAEMKQAESRLTMALERVEAVLDDGRPWLLDKYSLADICIIPVLTRLEDLGMNYLWDEFDYVAEWFQRFQGRGTLCEASYFGSLLSEQYGDLNIR